MSVKTVPGEEQTFGVSIDKDPYLGETELMRIQERITALAEFFREVRQELKKVTWPKRSEVIRATILTLVATILIAIYLALTDVILERGIRPLFKGSAGLWTLVMLAYFGIMMYLVYLTTRE